MDDIVRALNYVLDCSSQRVKWYIETRDHRHLEESKVYLDVANIYMNQLTKKEPCENQNQLERMPV
jgi:hypothetical protein